MPGSVEPVANEREGLLGYLDHQRLVLRIAAYGLSDQRQARSTPTQSTLSVGGPDQARGLRGASLDEQRAATGEPVGSRRL